MCNQVEDAILATVYAEALTARRFAEAEPEDQQ